MYYFAKPFYVPEVICTCALYFSPTLFEFLEFTERSLEVIFMQFASTFPVASYLHRVKAAENNVRIVEKQKKIFSGKYQY